MSSREKDSVKEEEIRKEAKRILDKFAKALASVKEIPDSFIEREKDRREEGEEQEPDSDFREMFFENAPSTRKECIEAERGGWK